MTNHDDSARDIDREVRYIDGDASHVEAEGDGEPVPGDEALEYLDSETLASWNLKRIRTVAGISQQQIADSLAEKPGAPKLGQTQIAKIERGVRPWRVNELFAIAETLGVRWTELFNGQFSTSDESLIVLGARIRYMQAREVADRARESFREAADQGLRAGLDFVRTAVEQGVKDPAAMNFLEMQYHRQAYFERIERLNEGPFDDYDEGQVAAKEYAEGEWERLVEQAAREVNPQEEEKADDED